MDLIVKELNPIGDKTRYKRGIEIIKSAGLPVDDIIDGKIRFFGFYSSGILIGVAGLEAYRDGILLRSVAVKKEERGKGFGSEIVKKMLQVARADYNKDVYLLTETAARFFKDNGFKQINRDDVPPGIAASSEFSQICPASAKVMMKQLQK